MGPILGASLSLAGTADTVQRGVGLLVAYSAGPGVPFPPVRGYARGLPRVTNYYLALNAGALALTPDWLLVRL